MAAPPAKPSADKKPVLVQLDMDFNDGGSSPWFNNKGRAVMAGLTSDPENAGLFSELALDGTMEALINYLDTEQPTLGRVALFCYVLLGLVLLELLLALPLCAFTLRRYTSTVGTTPWIVSEFVLLGCAGMQMASLLAMFSTWNGMSDGLNDKMPQAYAWTFQLLRNYTQLTALQLKEAKDPAAKDIDKALALTTSSIKWLQGNLSTWEDAFSGYENLKRMLTGPLTMGQMALLGFGLTAAVASALVACGAWSRRRRNLEAGGKSPVFVALALLAGTVLLFAHLLVALPMVARWLYVSVLADTYLCAPYRGDSYALLDESVAKVWPPTARPEPFCRLVPSAVRSKCSVKGTTSIKELKACPVAKKVKALLPDAASAASQFLRQKPPQPPENPAPPAGAAKAKKPVGDCFYPYKIVDTDMTAACPLFTDELIGHWMALVIAVLLGLISSFAAGVITVIFFAVGEKKKKVSKKIVRKKRVKKKKKKPKTPPTPPPPPSPPPPEAPPPPPPPPEPQQIEIEVPVPVPVIVRPKHRRRRPRPPMPPPIFVFPPPPPAQCNHQRRHRRLLPMLAAPVGTVPCSHAAASTPATPSPIVVSPSGSLYQQAAASYSNVTLYGGGVGSSLASARSQRYAAFPTRSSSRTVVPATTVQVMPTERSEAGSTGAQPVVTRYRIQRPQL